MDFKLTSDNFKVIEDLDFDLNGTRYLYFKLKKKDIDTISALRLLSKKLKVPMDRFGYAGLKDKNAVTGQYVSVHGVPKSKLENLKLDSVQVEVLGSSDKRIFLGGLNGNWFEVNVGDFKFIKSDFFENYFGEQRFGNKCENHKIGKLLLLRKYDDEKVLERLYLNSYQSYLWNLLVYNFVKKEDGFDVDYCLGKYRFVKKKIKSVPVPLINFDTEFKGIANNYVKILQDEGIKTSDFILKQKPYLVSDTVFRDLICDVKEISYKNKVLKFFLGKGSYASVYLKKVISDS